jgi:predicted transposase YdaD
MMQRAKAALDDLSQDALLREQARKRELELIYQQEQIDVAAAEGEAKGRIEGEAKGRIEGERRLLLQLLRRKFGELPESVTARVDLASEPELAAWAERVLSAQSLDDVF